MSAPLHVRRAPSGAYWQWDCRVHRYTSYAATQQAALNYALWHCARHTSAPAPNSGRGPATTPALTTPVGVVARPPGSGPGTGRGPVTPPGPRPLTSPASGGRGEGRTTYV